MTDLNEVVKEANNPKWMNDTFALSNMIKMAHAFSMCSYNCCYVADQVVHKCIFISNLYNSYTSH